MSFAVAAFGVAHRVSAQTTAPAEALLQHGLELRRESRDAEALEEFRRSYALAPSGRGRAQIALALQALGRWIDAEAELAAALADHDDPWLARNRDALEKAQRTISQHLGTFEATSNVALTEIFVNGVRLAPGQALRVVAGSMIVEARAAGYLPMRRLVEVPPGGAARESFEMAKLESIRLDEPARAAAPLPAPHVVELPSAGARTVPQQMSSRGTWGWAAIVAGGVSASAAVVATVVRENNAHIYNDEARCPAADRSLACGSQRDTVNVAGGVAVAGYVIAGALLTTGVVLLGGASHHQAVSARRIVRLTGWLVPQAGGLTFEQSF